MKLRSLSAAERAELTNIVESNNARLYQGTYKGRCHVTTDFAIVSTDVAYKEIIMQAVEQIRNNALDGEEDIANGFVNIVEALVYCYKDNMGKDEMIYY